jgi:hypothetical protein
MNGFTASVVTALLIVTSAFAQPASKTLSDVPAQSVTVSDWYKQSVYDASNDKVGDVRDVLLSPDGKVTH